MFKYLTIFLQKTFYLFKVYGYLLFILQQLENTLLFLLRDRLIPLSSQICLAAFLKLSDKHVISFVWP